MYYVVADRFNDRVISRHRSIPAACRALLAFKRRFLHQNPEGSYLPLGIRKQVSGELVELTSCEDDEVYCTFAYLD